VTFLPSIVRVPVAIVMFATVACARPADNAALPRADSSVVTPSPTTAAATPSPWALTAFGMGALHAGTSYQAANDSVHGALHAEAKANLAECSYVQWDGAPAGVLVMVSEGRIGRIDVTTTGVTTDAGAKIGDSEAAVQSMYPGAVVTPHKYSDGHYLTVAPANASDTLHRLVFETEHGKVTRMRGGVVPAVEYAEGCS
jgi:hypothetical protein